MFGNVVKQGCYGGGPSTGHHLHHHHHHHLYFNTVKYIRHWTVNCFDSIFRKTLEHGKHVLVDFPLSLTAQGGKELFSMAESKGNTVDDDKHIKTT